MGSSRDDQLNETVINRTKKVSTGEPLCGFVTNMQLIDRFLPYLSIVWHDGNNTT